LGNGQRASPTAVARHRSSRSFAGQIQEDDDLSFENKDPAERIRVYYLLHTLELQFEDYLQEILEIRHPHVSSPDDEPDPFDERRGQP
jgi:hypothetical protein